METSNFHSLAREIKELKREEYKLALIKLTDMTDQFGQHRWFRDLLLITFCEAQYMSTILTKKVATAIDSGSAKQMSDATKWLSNFNHTQYVVKYLTSLYFPDKPRHIRAHYGLDKIMEIPIKVDLDFFSSEVQEWVKNTAFTHYPEYTLVPRTPDFPYVPNIPGYDFTKDQAISTLSHCTYSIEKDGTVKLSGAWTKDQLIKLTALLSLEGNQQ